MTSGMTSRPIVFFGTEDFSAISLTALIDAGFNVAAVVTKPDSRSGRGQRLSAPAVKRIAEQNSILAWQPSKLSDIADAIKSLQPVTGVLVSYGKILPQDMIDLFDPGIINLHPSLLPAHRGPSPIETTIANRDSLTGVTLMELSAQMDAGPIYAQLPYALDQRETKPELYDTLGLLGANLLVSKLPAIIDGSLKPEPQDDAQASYTQLLDKSSNLIDPQTMTPGEAEARIRAHIGFPRSRIMIEGQPVIITKSHVVMTAESILDIPFQNGAFLRVDELLTPSGKLVDGPSYLNGRR